MDAAEVLAQLRSDDGLREMARAMLLGDELLRLPEAFARLEAIVARLAAGQAQLFEGQAKLEATVARLEATVARLAEGQAQLLEGQAKLFEGQAKLFEGQAKLFEGQAALRREMGSLSRTLGGTAEEDALDVVEHVMRLRGYRLLGEPAVMDLDGDGELDVAARGEDAAGRQISVIAEAKVRLRAREVREWSDEVRKPAFQRRLAELGLPGPYLVYAYGIRVYPEAREVASGLGVGVLSSKGEIVAAEVILA